MISQLPFGSIYEYMVALCSERDIGKDADRMDTFFSWYVVSNVIMPSDRAKGPKESLFWEIFVPPLPRGAPYQGQVKIRAHFYYSPPGISIHFPSSHFLSLPILFLPRYEPLSRCSSPAAFVRRPRKSKAYALSQQQENMVPCGTDRL